MPNPSPGPPQGYAQQSAEPPAASRASIAQPKHITLGSKFVQRRRLSFPGGKPPGRLDDGCGSFHAGIAPNAIEAEFGGLL